MRASLEKVENVVNPPHRPTVRNRDHELPSLEVLLNEISCSSAEETAASDDEYVLYDVNLHVQNPVYRFD